MKITILSPHIDDAAYSLAITINRLVQNKVSVNVINCFTISNWTIRYVEGSTKDITVQRKKEDAAFFKKYARFVSVTHLDMLDAPLRNASIFKQKPFRKSDLEVIEILKKYLLENAEGILLAPIAIGNHIDHSICNEVASQLQTKLKVIFYEDLPYANRFSEKAMLTNIKKLQQKTNSLFVNQIVDAVACNKENELSVYKTQLNGDVLAEISARREELGGERIWGNSLLIGKFASLVKKATVGKLRDKEPVSPQQLANDVKLQR